MLLRLHQKALRPLSESSPEPFVGRLCDFPALPEGARGREILFLRTPHDDLPKGFRAYLLHKPAPTPSGLRDAYLLDLGMNYLAHGDVVRIDARRGTISALYRRGSMSNALLVTEQCNSCCVMCSQPPKIRDDSWILDELAEVVPLISPETREIGVTGGEPTLLGERLFELVDMLLRHLPRTSVHLLSNGRRFSDPGFAQGLARARHPDLMIGIPLYSDLPEEHDYVVQVRGAFSETIRGILNLKRLRQRVELRCVIHAETHERLTDLARFVVRNLLFVDHVALMGLELVGFARKNIDSLWVDPLDYQDALVEAVEILDRAGMIVSIYGHQLCVLHERVHRFARKSISDWKNAYFDACGACTKREECGGFFASADLRRSRGIHAV